MSETVINTVIIAVPLDLAKLPTLSMYYHTCRIDNGFGSRRSLLTVLCFLKRPQKSIR